MFRFLDLFECLMHQIQHHNYSYIKQTWNVGITVYLHYRNSYYYGYYYYYYLAHQHKATGMKNSVSKNKNNDHDGVSHGVQCSQEAAFHFWRAMNSRLNRNTISLVFHGYSDQFNGGLVPGASSVICHWKRFERQTARYTLQSCLLLPC